MISVIVVSYCTREKLRKCLSCIERDHEIIVVDNNSDDGSCEMVRESFPWVKLLAQSSNLGFAAANNLGAEHATGELLLFLNSDAYAEPGSIALLGSIFDDPTVVGAGGKLLNMDGSLQNSTAKQLSLRAVVAEQLLIEKIFPSYWTTPTLAIDDLPKETPQVMGACLMVRRGAVVPLWDTRFFLYCEDSDLCLRLGEKGKILYVPKARFTHELGSSSKRDPWKGIARYNAGKELYFRIHGSAVASLICFLLNRIGALVRLILWLIALPVKRSAWSQIATFWKVLTCPFQGPPRS